jgi:hypothetical protein
MATPATIIVESGEGGRFKVARRIAESFKGPDVTTTVKIPDMTGAHLERDIEDLSRLRREEEHGRPWVEGPPRTIVESGDGERFKVYSGIAERLAGPGTTTIVGLAAISNATLEQVIDYLADLYRHEDSERPEVEELQKYEMWMWHEPASHIKIVTLLMRNPNNWRWRYLRITGPESRDNALRLLLAGHRLKLDDLEDAATSAVWKQLFEGKSTKEMYANFGISPKRDEEEGETRREEEYEDEEEAL